MTGWSFERLTGHEPEPSVTFQFRSWGHGWARIYFFYRTEPSSSGHVVGGLTAVSDYGSYGYVWGGIGRLPEETDVHAFLSFMLRCRKDPSYFAIKLAAGRKEFDQDHTERAVREYIIESRRNGSMDAETARREWDLIDRLDDPRDWVEASKLPAAYEFLMDRIPLRVTAFVERVLAGPAADAIEQFLAANDLDAVVRSEP